MRFNLYCPYEEKKTEYFPIGNGLFRCVSCDNVVNNRYRIQRNKLESETENVRDDTLTLDNVE